MPPEEDETPAAPPETVPKATMLERLAGQKIGHEKALAVVQKKLSAASDATAEAEAKLTAFVGVDLEKLNRQIVKANTRAEDAEAALHGYEVQAAANLVWTEAGVADPKTQQVVAFHYSLLEEEGRPTLAEYIAGPAREDPYLAPHLGAEPVAPVRQSFDPNTGVVPSQGLPGGSRAEQVARLDSYGARLKAVGSHEALESLMGYAISRPKQRST